MLPCPGRTSTSSLRDYAQHKRRGRSRRGYAQHFHGSPLPARIARITKAERRDATNEFEAATIAYQQAALAITYWQTGLSALTLLVPSGLVLYGFRLMRLGTEERREEARQQHEEAMTALKALISGMKTAIARTAKD